MAKQGKSNSFNVASLQVTGILLANGDELNFVVLKFARPLYFFKLVDTRSVETSFLR